MFMCSIKINVFYVALTFTPTLQKFWCTF